MYNFEYMNKVDELLHTVDDANKEKIQELACLLYTSGWTVIASPH